MSEEMIYFIGDLHGGEANEMPFLNSTKFPEQKQMTRNDVLIQTGDFGMYWSYPDTKYFKREEHYLNWIAKRNYTFLFVDGNHENFNIINALPTKQLFGGLVHFDRRKCGCIYHLIRGEVYTINNKKCLAIGGATSNDKEHRTLDISYWEQETLNYKEQDKILQAIEDNPDIDMIISHTFPSFIIDEMLGNSIKKTCLVSIFLDEVYKLLKPKLWIGGHLHVNKDIQYENTRFICNYKNNPVKIA